MLRPTVLTSRVGGFLVAMSCGMWSVEQLLDRLFHLASGWLDVSPDVLGRSVAGHLRA